MGCLMRQIYLSVFSLLGLINYFWAMKENNPFFDPKYIRNIYTLTGIVKPVVFYKGRFVATWKRDKGTILLDILKASPKKKKRIRLLPPNV